MENPKTHVMLVWQAYYLLSHSLAPKNVLKCGHVASLSVCGKHLRRDVFVSKCLGFWSIMWECETQQLIHRTRKQRENA